MKKSVKRILCGVLSVAMCSTLVVESVLRLQADGGVSMGGTTTTAQASFTNVTGQVDTSFRESYFNSSVLKTEDVAPRYETRTVMVTLSGESMIERANGADVPAYADSWSGEVAKSEIDREQTAFLQALSRKGISYEVEHSYNTVVNAVAVKLDTKYVSEIKKMKGVDSVVITKSYDLPKTVDTSNSDVVTNETDVYETGIYDSSAYAAKYGEGTVVAVLDTGLDYTHPAFQDFKSDNVNYSWDKDYIKSVLDSKELAAEKRSGALDASDVYVSEKVPYAYDYADDDPDVYPSYSNHGTHVAGIIGGYDPSGYTDKDGNPITDKQFLSVVPDSQLVICKVFTDDLDDPDLGGAVTEDIVAALEDCVNLGVDVINMSLGTTCGFTTTDDGDDEGEMLNKVYNSITEVGISLICAASNDYSAGYGGVYGTNLASNPDAGTVGSPSTYASALSVASINGQKASYFVANAGDADKKAYVFFEEARDINSNPLDFVADLQKNHGKSEFEYVVIPGVGKSEDYTNRVKRLLKDTNGHSTGRLALIKRGDSTFQEKVEIAMEMGAAGVIIYNNVAGSIRMNLGEVENPVPSVSIGMNAGNAMVANAVSRVGTIKIDESFAAGPFMSDFSSWGPTPDLKLKPEITAHGGEITSAVPGGYGEQSGTSMATPNMAGFMALVRSYIKKDLGLTNPVEINRLAMQLTMSTAGTVYDQDNLPYSPRKQGAGVAKLENVIGGTKAYLSTDVAANDYRPKIELGDDPDQKGVYTLNFKVTNFGNSALNFKPQGTFMTETLSSDKLTVSEQAYMLENSKAVWSVDGENIETTDTITVNGNTTREITVVLTLGDDDRTYIEESFENGMYVEGFAKLLSETSGQCDLSIPFLGFYGDWDDAPMLDYSAYEVAENQQDSSILEEDKIKASVWETQPYLTYYNEKYILPMGSYLYAMSEEDLENNPMYISEEHNSVSRYNEYYGETSNENYMTSTGLKAVYAGLLRNARLVRYNLVDEATGEVILSDVVHRVGKAYSGGGSAVPANVELDIFPEEIGLLANGRYKMHFEFFKDEPTADQVAREEDTFEFSFTIDYEAPMLEDARVRYYNYKDGNKEKQRIYLDVDIYDNHYAQSIMLCYPKMGSDGELTLQLATDYPTPVRDGVRNGTTTVSLEITDIYEKYGDQLYLMIDDYSVNSAQYRININEANANVLPDGEDFGLAAGEDKVSVNIYGTHKTALVYGESYTGTADKSNFLWTSANPKIAEVKNGEIVGLSKGTTKVFVSNRKGATKTIEVTVSDVISAELPTLPSVSFGLIQTDVDALQKANGVVEVCAGRQIEMSIETDPWYHPMTDLKIVWASTNPNVATVSDTGIVSTLKKGTAVISATLMQKNSSGKWEETLYSATSIMQVQNEFKVSNYSLTDYNGVGYTDGDVLVIPSDLNVMYIGSEAFKDNTTVRKIVIPSSVVEIQERAFYNCTSLEEVYFVSTEKQEIADADISMIYEQAFYGCTNLKKIDFSNVKTVTIAADCFANCPKLAEVVDMPSIGTMHHRAFAGTALKEVDISALHMSGSNVFEGCKQLTKITTGKFTAIGDYMFKDCVGLKNEVVINTPKIGNGAFSGCTNLAGVKIASPEGEVLEFDIGARAFENCGSNLRGNFYVDFGGEYIRSIGERAFAGSTLKTLDAVHGLEVLGANAFANTYVRTITLNDELDIANIRLTGIPFDGLTVKVAPTSQKYQEENGVIYSKDKTQLLYVNASVEGEFTVPTGVTAIGDYAFGGSKVRKVILCDSVATIGVGAFKDSQLRAIDFAGSAVSEISANAFENSSLTEIVLPNSVKTIGDYAFANTALSSFEGMGLEHIGSYVFKGNVALTSVKLADGVKSMGEYVFYNCTALEKITLPSLENLGSYTFWGATALKEVAFGANTKSIGSYTFARTRVTKVTLGNVLETVGEGAFYDCTGLKEITLPESVTKIEAAAFNGCTNLTKVNGIENVESFGIQAFYNASLTSLQLTAAKHIGYMAFATHAQRKPTYTTLSIPVVEVIESYAFFNGGEAKLTLPKTLKEVQAAAFASSDKLATVTVEAGNASFFAEDNVLYRYTNKEAKEYELVYYPTARIAKGAEGSRTYEVKEGTVRILAYAFYALNDKAVNAVKLPYSVKAIGDSAFFESGITDYTFESIQAPYLETVYRAEIQDAIEALENESYYRGYFYTNFYTYLYYYTKFVGMESPLVMHYPSNGTGYDNHVYTTYFGERYPSEKALIEDNTRAYIDVLTKMPTAEEIAVWADLEKTEENKAMVLAFAEQMKTARGYYNNAKEKDGQAVFITEALEKKMFAIEETLREVKTAHGIPFVVKGLKVAEDSAHKAEYLIGEEFDMTGLSLVIVYDDESTEAANFEDLVLLTTGELADYNKYAEVSYDGIKVRVPIKVTDGTEELPPDSSDEEDSSFEEEAPLPPPEKEKIDYMPLVIVLGGVVVIMAIVLLIVGGVSASKTKKQAKADEKAEKLQSFKDAYGELHVNVTAVVAEDEKAKKGKNTEVETTLDLIVNKFAQPPVDVPDGGKVTTDVKIEKK